MFHFHFSGMVDYYAYIHFCKCQAQEMQENAPLEA